MSAPEDGINFERDVLPVGEAARQAQAELGGLAEINTAATALRALIQTTGAAIQSAQFAERSGGRLTKLNVS